MRTVAIVNLRTIEANLNALMKCAQQGFDTLTGAVPMVKASAYGHGLVEVSRVFDAHAGVLALGVATIEEGTELRAAGITKPIWVFSGAIPWNADVSAACARHALSPILSTAQDLRLFLKDARRKEIPGFHLKFNTGMNRLGIESAEVSAVRKEIEQADVKPVGLCTHFAEAEKPLSAPTKVQVKCFEQITRDFSSFNSSYIHCANSAAVLEKLAGVGKFTNVIRPGIGLYGYGSPLLKPALQWKALVAAVRQLAKGDRVGYAGTYRASRSQRQAVLSVGYGDGLMRAVANRQIRIHREMLKVIGRVSMDLASLEMKKKLFKAGDLVTLLGEDHEQAKALEKATGTIVYELLTNISKRVPRVYIK